jgi:hypothetical protein
VELGSDACRLCMDSARAGESDGRLRECARMHSEHGTLRDMRLLVIGASVVTACGLVPTATAVADFRTPERAAYCGGSHGEPPYSLICWRPKDGLTVHMLERGRASKYYNPRNRGLHDIAPRIVAFGGHWHPRLLDYWCTNRRTGLTCWNRDGHGWWLGRYRGYRLF